MGKTKTNFAEDTSYYNEEVAMGIAHCQGKRPSQEDAYAMNCLEISAATMQEAEWDTVLNNTMDKLQKTLSNEKLPNAEKKPTISNEQVIWCAPSIAETQGTTACLAAYADKQLHISNVGDSLAFLVTIEKNGSAICAQLNTIHSIEEEQNKRLLKTGGKRLLNSKKIPQLSLARALGDNEYEDSGLIHTPENTHYTINFDQGRRQFLIVACDGLTENDAVTLEDIESILKKNKNTSTDEIAALLIDKATLENYGRKHASGDNVTVMVKELKMDTAPFYAAVFDGHGGSQVSTYCANAVDDILKSELSPQLIIKSCQEYKNKLLTELKYDDRKLPFNRFLGFDIELIKYDLSYSESYKDLAKKYNLTHDIQKNLENNTLTYQERFSAIGKILNNKANKALLEKNRDSQFKQILNDLFKIITLNFDKIGKPKSQQLAEDIQEKITSMRPRL